jgi:hypothetical protein
LLFKLCYMSWMHLDNAIFMLPVLQRQTEVFPPGIPGSCRTSFTMIAEA